MWQAHTDGQNTADSCTYLKDYKDLCCTQKFPTFFNLSWTKNHSHLPWCISPPTDCGQMSLVSPSLHSPPTQSVAVKNFVCSSAVWCFSTSSFHPLIYFSLLSLSMWAGAAEHCDSYSYFCSEFVHDVWTLIWNCRNGGRFSLKVLVLTGCVDFEFSCMFL